LRKSEPIPTIAECSGRQGQPYRDPRHADPARILRHVVDAVREGDVVKRGQIMGKSGMTGMAGGDHIHFSMQLDGVQIDPKEFFDAHWIKDRVARRVDLPGFR
jgi:hypothetical protein